MSETLTIEIPPKLSKELIEDRVGQETLMSTYFGVPIKRGLFKSTLRSDKSPTCGYYRNSKGRLIVKDFGSDFCGDWISVLRYKFNCDYTTALRIAANDFGIIKNPKLVKSKIIHAEETLPETKQAIIQVEIRPFQDYELEWWGKFGITEKTLKKFKVFSCKNIWLNGNLFHLEKDKQLVFGYYGGIKDGIELWRIYFADRRGKIRFVSNWKKNRLQGAHVLPKEGADILCVTKSMKDVMLLYELGIPAIAPCSENLFLTEKQYNALRPNFKHCIVLYDNDCAGITNLRAIKKQYPEVTCTCIPRKYHSKDISDFYKAHGKRKTIELINKAKEYYLNGGKERKSAEKLWSKGEKEEEH